MTLRSAVTLVAISGSLIANPEPSSPTEAQPPAESASHETTVFPGEQPAPAPDAAQAVSAVSHAAVAESSKTTEPASSPSSASAAPHSPLHPSTEGATSAPAAHGGHIAVAHTTDEKELASLLRIGRIKREQGDFTSAEIAFTQVLAERATREQDREAILGLARTYRKKADFTKAAASYERFAKEFPGDPELPTVFLELGRTFRALGAYKQAISRFYSVLNSTLKLTEQGGDEYRQLVRTAQYEIAETYFQTGDYLQANRFFSRLKLLDLAPEDRARAHFKSVFALTLSGDHEKAAVGLRSFLDQYPDDENVPEAQYLLSVSLHRLSHNQESLQVTLQLLKAESTRTKKDPRRWQYWQRKTGNQLANEFYENGEFNKALQIYVSLTDLSPEPVWNLPVRYQMGLCYERMRQFDRARECYTAIVERVKDEKADPAAHPELSDLAEMAAWRLGQINWQAATDSQLSLIFNSSANPPPAALPPPPPSTPPSPVSAADHDAHGSATVASHAVR